MDIQSLINGLADQLRGNTPPTATNNVFNRFYGNFYVPDYSVKAYKASTYSFKK